MVLKADFLNPKRRLDSSTWSELADFGKKLAQMELLPATSGNLSIRAGGSIKISLSGLDKANLGPEDYVEIDFGANIIKDFDKKASAEALLHCVLYEFYPDIQAVFHVHSQSAVIISKIFGSNSEFYLEDYELLKALDGIFSHKHKELIPIFANSQNIKSLAEDVKQFLAIKSDIHAYIIEGHGLYVWGKSCQETFRQLEAIEAMMKCEIELFKIKGK